MLSLNNFIASRSPFYFLTTVDGSARKMPKKSEAKHDETDWMLFIQQEDPEVNADLADSTLNSVKHIDRNFKRYNSPYLPSLNHLPDMTD